MSKSLPPYAKQLIVPKQIPFIMLFVGPDGWSHVKKQMSYGLRNSLCLPDISLTHQYHWPVADCIVIVFLLSVSSSNQEASLMAELCRNNPREVTMGHYPGGSLIVRRRVKAQPDPSTHR